ncbi:unnamed protein product, partial [Closterium sp. NIES-53]
MAPRFSYLFRLLMAFTVSCAIMTCGSSLRLSNLFCSRTCAEFECNTLIMRYGKYCGVKWTGCSGQAPCDDVDNCCMQHDNCVEANGNWAIPCHQELKRCVKAVQESGKTGFSWKCPY